jgi:hypothetical protein
MYIRFDVKKFDFGMQSIAFCFCLFLNIWNIAKKI